MSEIILMASRRHQRRKFQRRRQLLEDRACKNKIRHATYASAMTHLIQLQDVFGEATDLLDVYRCEFCDGFHLGRNGRSRDLA